jgi:hypothetical protein
MGKKANWQSGLFPHIGSESNLIYYCPPPLHTPTKAHYFSQVVSETSVVDPKESESFGWIRIRKESSDSDQDTVVK